MSQWVGGGGGGVEGWLGREAAKRQSQDPLQVWRTREEEEEVAYRVVRVQE